MSQEEMEPDTRAMQTRDETCDETLMSFAFLMRDFFIVWLTLSSFLLSYSCEIIPHPLSDTIR